jgi:YVTN family beta-propeller protein
MTLLSVILVPNNINAESNTFNNVTTLHAHTLDTIVHRTNITQASAQIKVGHSPISVIVNDYKMSSKIYVANSGSDNISVIDGTNNVKLKDIPVGVDPVYMALYPPNKIYVANSGSGSISVIDTITDTRVKDISVGEHPDYIAVDERQQKIYVANQYGGISVIDAGKNIKIGTIERIVPTCSNSCIANATAIGPLGFTMFTVVRDGISVFNTGNDTYIKTIET